MKTFLNVANKLFLLIAIIMFLGNAWFFNNFMVENMDQLLFHLEIPQRDTGAIDFFYSFILEVIVPTIVISMILVLISVNYSIRKSYISIKAFNLVKEIQVFPLKTKWYLMFICALILITVPIYSFEKQLNIVEYVSKSNTSSLFIRENYVNPNDVTITFPEEKRNLIYIILESVETTFSSHGYGGSYEYNSIPELTKIAQENISFSGGNDLGGSSRIAGTTWTMGSLVSQTAGIPLKVPGGYGNQLSQFAYVLPGVITIGEILEHNGYNQSFLMGSLGSYAGRDTYLSQKGGYKIMDLNWAKEAGKLPDDYRVWWGYEDSKLFEYAKEEILLLEETGDPFNMSLLTVNTHHIDGYLEEECPIDYEHQFTNVMRCSSYQVANFIDWIKQQSFYENTTIVVVSDHLSMDPNYFSGIDINKRYPYNAIINSPIEPIKEKNKPFAAFDWFPTTLAALGVEIEGDQLGMGINLFSDEETLVEKYGVEHLNDEFRKYSTFYNDYFHFAKEIRQYYPN